VVVIFFFLVPFFFKFVSILSSLSCHSVRDRDRHRASPIGSPHCSNYTAMGPSVVLVAVVIIIPSLVAGTRIDNTSSPIRPFLSRRQHFVANNTSSPIRTVLRGRQHFVADNISSPISTILRDDNELDEGPHYRESEDAGRPLLHAKRMRESWYQKQQRCKREKKPTSWECYKGWKYLCVEMKCHRTLSPISYAKQSNAPFYDKKGYVKCRSHSDSSDCKTYWEKIEAKTPGAIPCTYGKWARKKYPCEKGFRYGCGRWAGMCWRELKHSGWEWLKGKNPRYPPINCENDSQCKKLVIADGWPKWLYG